MVHTTSGMVTQQQVMNKLAELGWQYCYSAVSQLSRARCESSAGLFAPLNTELGCLDLIGRGGVLPDLRAEMALMISTSKMIVQNSNVRFIVS